MPAILEILALLLPLLLAVSKSLIKGKMKYVIAIVAYFIIKKMAVEAARQKALSEIQGTGGYSNANAMATLYKQALNPSGYEWAMSSDGTNEALLYELAAKTQSYEAVYKAYKVLYKRDLTTDLQDELDTDEYKRLLDILNI